MRFINSAITTMIFKAIAMISGVAVSVVIARILGPEGRGVYSLVMTIIVMAASFGVFGLTASNTYFVARNENMSRTVGVQSTLVSLIGTLLSIIAILFINYFSPQTLQGLSPEIMWLTIALIPFFLCGNLFAFAYLGRGRILAFNTFETGQRVIFFALSAVTLGYLGWEFKPYLTTVVIAIIVLVSLYVFFYFFRAAAGPVYESGYTSKSLAYGIKSYIATMLTLAVMRSGILFVNNYKGTDDAGFFAVAQQISELVIIIPTIVGTLLFGRVSKGNSSNLTPVVLRTLAALFLPVAVIMFFAGDWIIRTIFGNEFAQAVPALKLLLPGAYLLGLEVIIANDIAGRGYRWPAVLSWVPVLIITITGFVILIPKFGINGAAVTVSISYFVIFVLLTGYYLKLSGFRLGQILILKRADLELLISGCLAVISRKSVHSNKGISSADQAVPDKVKAEMPGVGR